MIQTEYRCLHMLIVKRYIQFKKLQCALCITLQYTNLSTGERIQVIETLHSPLFMPTYKF